MSNYRLSDQQIAQLMQMASKKMGVSEGELKKQLQQASIDPKSVKLPPSAQEVLSDPKKLEALLNSDKAKALLNGLMKK